MASKFHKNAILTGNIDSYCLVCESHLRSEEDITIHIAKPIHSKNLDATDYLEKYKDDCIRKVKKGYFCEFCNLLLSTAAKVGLHAAELKHIDNKGSQLLKRVGNNIIAYRDIVINEKAWNGLIGDTCAICNTEFENESIHKTESTHILNLVQIKVEFGTENLIYRKMDDSSYQCLTCNIILAMNSLTTHFSQQDHKELFSMCRQTDSEADTETNNNEKEPKDNESKSSQGMKPGKPHGNIKYATHDFEEEVAKYLGAFDYISDDDNGNKWCILCDWTLDCKTPAHVKTHLTGRHHQTMLKLHKARLQEKKKLSDSVETTKEVQIVTTEDVKTVATKEVEIETKPEEPKENPEKLENKSKILDSVTKFQKNDININFETGTAVCKKCASNVDFKFESIEAHIEEHKMKTPKKETPKPFGFGLKPDEVKKNTLFSSPVTKKRKDSVESRASSSASKDMDEESEKFAKANNLTISRSDNKVYCRICDTKIPSSLKNMKEHITGSSHKNRAAKVSEFKQSLKPTNVKVPMGDFVKNMIAIENMFFQDVIINEKYCVNILSFFTFTKQDFRLRCQICEVNITIDQVDEHKAKKKHEKVLHEIPVLTSYESEFIREVRSGLFHCGFCNLIEPSIEDLDNHLKSTTHREAKTSSNWRLQQYMPEIAQHRARKEIEMVLLMRMLMNGNPFL